jgi:transcription elongation factor GreA
LLVKETYLTPEGAARLRAELEQLKNEKRPALAARLREAIQMGDLSENADYIMAKEDQAFLEGRIQELETVLRNATVVAPSGANGGARHIGVGCRVTVQEKGEAPEEFHLVGAKEADPRTQKISNESPIGRALMGRREGEKVEVETPGGVLQLEILRVEC